MKHLQSIQARHVNIEQHEVEPSRAIRRDGIRPVIHFSKLESWFPAT